MEGKKSFLLYCDQIGLFEQLPDEQAGKLIKLIFSYVNDQNPVMDDLLLKVAFEPIKLQLKRDLSNWNNIVERNRINGAKGGRPPKPKEPTGLSGNPKEPRKADSVSKSDSKSVSDKDKTLDQDELDHCFDQFWKSGIRKVNKKKTAALFSRI